jgi:hypothetical protein
MDQSPLKQSLDPSIPGELERLAANVLHRLSSRVLDLCLAWRGGGLILRGRAATYYAKQLAQHAVMAATTAPILANEIEVRVS